MIREISIENFKSVEKLTLPLGRVNVLIGENGAGKSNILEGVALLSAATAEKLEVEFLYTRGVRVTTDKLMCSAFPTRLITADEDPYVVLLSAHNGEKSKRAFRKPVFALI